MGLQLQYQDHFPDANVPGDSRAENVLPPCGQGLAGIGKAMSVTSSTKSESGLGETIRVVLHALVIALVIRTFLFQPFNIPSGSMKETLLVGDYLFVSKYSYGYSHYSIPLSPSLFSGRIFGSEPNRGDIVVFRLPKDDSTDYIKRVIGLPGDRIQMREGLLYINDKPIKRERRSDFIGEDPCGSDATARVKRWKETLPNGVSYESLDCADNGFYDNTNVYTVPAGHFFMMGDNRDNSTDSRVLSAVGYVPFENIVGRAQIIFFSIAEGEHAWMFWRWPTAVRWNRLFSIVR
jgi:signal peptidase I